MSFFPKCTFLKIDSLKILYSGNIYVCIPAHLCAGDLGFKRGHQLSRSGVCISQGVVRCSREPVKAVHHFPTLHKTQSCPRWSWTESYCLSCLSAGITGMGDQSKFQHLNFLLTHFSSYCTSIWKTMHFTASPLQCLPALYYFFSLSRVPMLSLVTVV